MSNAIATPINVKKTALLVIDMQNALVKVGEAPAVMTDLITAKNVIPNTASVIAAARAAGLPVIYSAHVKRADGSDHVETMADKPHPRSNLIEGTPSAAIVDELKPAEGDYYVSKRRSDAFFGSDLEMILRCLGTDTVLVTGVVTNGCIAATVEGANSRDFNVIVIGDCCATASAADDSYFLEEKFPLVARVRSAAEIAAAIKAAA